MGRLLKSPWRIKVTSGMKCGKERPTSNRGPAYLSRTSWYMSRAVTRLRRWAAGYISNHLTDIQHWLEISSCAHQLCKLWLGSKFKAPSVPPYIISNCCFPGPLKPILNSLPEMWMWISNYIYNFLWRVIPHRFPNFYCWLHKPLLNLGDYV